MHKAGDLIPSVTGKLSRAPGCASQLLHSEPELPELLLHILALVFCFLPIVLLLLS